MASQSFSFFFKHVLKKEYHSPKVLYGAHCSKLPAVMSVEEPGRVTKIRSYGYLANRGRTQRMEKITDAMHIPAHPPKVKTPWTLRLFEKFGIKHTTCPHCKKESLKLIRVSYPVKVVQNIIDDS
jgi:hypothetical protein